MAPPRMSLKPDASFFRKLAIGAVGARAVGAFLRESGHDCVELERGSLDTRVWKDVKRKRVRIPDLVCRQCGVRIESRAKTRPELSMSHSPRDAERSWDFGMVEGDLVAFPICVSEERSWAEGGLRGPRSLWRERTLHHWAVEGHINVVSVGAFRGTPFRTKGAKGAEEGAETQIAWPAKFAPAPGAVTRQKGRRLYYRRDDEEKERYFQLPGGMLPIHSPGGQFAAHQIVASSVEPVDADRLRCADDLSGEAIGRMLTSRERTLRFTGCRLARLRAVTSVADAAHELATDVDEDPYVRLEARSYICTVVEDDAPRWFGELIADHPDDQMRLEAVVALADTPTPSSFELLRQTLREQGYPLFLRSAAAWALGCHGTDDAARVLVEAFGDVDLTIKEDALAALTQIGASGSESLIWGLAHDADDVAAGAAEVLRRIGEVPIDEIRGMATAQEPRAWAVWTLAHLPREAVTPHIAAIQDGSPDVHYALTVLWTFLESWISQNWAKEPLP